MKMSLVLPRPRKMHLCSSSSKSHACHRFWKHCKTHTFGSRLTRCRIHYPCQEKKVLQTWSAFTILISTRASPQPHAIFNLSSSEALRGCQLLGGDWRVSARSWLARAGGGQLLQRPADPRFPAAVDNPAACSPVAERAPSMLSGVFSHIITCFFPVTMPVNDLHGKMKLE